MKECDEYNTLNLAPVIQYFMLLKHLMQFKCKAYNNPCIQNRNWIFSFSFWAVFENISFNVQ